MLDFKIKKCLPLKDTVKRRKEQATDWEEMFVKHVIKDSYHKYTRILKTQ